MKFSTPAKFLAVLLFPALAAPAAAQLKTIAEARQQEFNSTVTKVAGRVTVGGQFKNTAFIQDATGGMAIFNNQFRTGVQIGDSVEITDATLTDFQSTTGQPGTGLSELSGANLKFIVVPGARVTPEPRIMTIPSISENVEGVLVKIRSVRFVQTGAFQGETTYQIENNAGNRLDVRIDGGTEIAKNQPAIPAEKVDIVGVISQYRGSYQIQPRFVTDIGLEPIEVDTVSKNRTLDITTWNLLWFGVPDTSRGPRDKERQYRQIRQAMDSIRADLFALQEIAGEAYFDRLADTLNYGYLIAPIDQPQKMAYLYNQNTLKVVGSQLAVNGGSEAWANGRFPFHVKLNATIDGKTQEINAFVIHAKATDSATATNDLFRRKQDAETFYSYLNEFYGDRNVVVLGDFNDDVLTSVIDSSLPSPYKVFVDDTVNYMVVTKSLSERGLASYIGSNRNMLDHIIISNELKPQFHRAYLEAPNAFLSSYVGTTSDHLPVTVRLFAGQGPVSVEDRQDESDFSCRIANLADGSVMAEFLQQTAGNVRISLVNSVGSEVKVFTEGYSDAGIRILSIGSAEFASGAYYLRIVKDAAARTMPLVIVR